MSMACCNRDELRIRNMVTSIVEKIEIWSSQFAALHSLKHASLGIARYVSGNINLLHMLSIITRKSSSRLVMWCFLVVSWSQLLIAPTFSSKRVARLFAAVRTDSRLRSFPVNSQSLWRAGCMMKPISWVSVRVAIGCRGLDQAWLSWNS